MIGHVLSHEVDLHFDEIQRPGMRVVASKKLICCLLIETMEKLPDDLLLAIFRFLPFGDKKGRNIISTQRVNHRFHRLIYENVEFEIDQKTCVSSRELMKHFVQFYLYWKQEREASLDWEDHRGFLIITDFHEDRWLYYDRLLKKYNFDPRPSKFPHFRGQMFFYEYPY